MKSSVTVVKIGGQVLDDESSLATFLSYFAQVPGKKILVHGGGKMATELSKKLNLQPQMIDGRRVTDTETLKVVTMVYAGWINKNLVAALAAKGVPAFGVSGADGDLIRSQKRPVNPVDFGWVGDVQKVRADRLSQWLSEGITPVIAPITHDGAGQLLNTNADTIATTVAVALSEFFTTTLLFTFEKSGVLAKIEDESSLIPEINASRFAELKAERVIHSGMIPKLENAFQAIDSGVTRVILGKAEALPSLLAGTAGTRLIRE